MEDLYLSKWSIYFVFTKWPLKHYKNCELFLKIYKNCELVVSINYLIYKLVSI